MSDTQNNLPMNLVMKIRKDALEMKKVEEGRMIHKRMMTKKHLEIIKQIPFFKAITGSPLKRVLKQGVGGGMRGKEELEMNNECCLCEDVIKGREVWSGSKGLALRCLDYDAYSQDNQYRPNRNALACCWECAVEDGVCSTTGQKYDTDDTWVGRNIMVDNDTGLLLYKKDPVQNRTFENQDSDY